MPNYLEFPFHLFIFSITLKFFILHLPNNINMKFNAEVKFD